MTFRKMFFQINRRIGSFPYDLCDKITFPKHFIAHLFQVCLLVIVNTYKNNAVVGEQVFGDFQPQIHHVQPIGMESPVTFGILKKPVALLVKLPTVVDIFIGILCKVVFIHKVVARIVRGINVNHFNFAEICFLQQF